MDIQPPLVPPGIGISAAACFDRLADNERASLRIFLRFEQHASIIAGWPRIPVDHPALAIKLPGFRQLIRLMEPHRLLKQGISAPHRQLFPATPAKSVFSSTARKYAPSRWRHIAIHIHQRRIFQTCPDLAFHVFRGMP